jgi:hypothetical protein
MKDYVFEGMFENDLPNGHGKESKFGVIYEGNFKDGLFSGEGSLKFPDGTNYNGHFLKNVYEG